MKVTGVLLLLAGMYICSRVCGWCLSTMIKCMSMCVFVCVLTLTTRCSPAWCVCSLRGQWDVKVQSSVAVCPNDRVCSARHQRVEVQRIRLLVRGRRFGDSRRRRGQVRNHGYVHGCQVFRKKKTFSGVTSCRCCRTHDKCYEESRKIPGCTAVGDLPYIIDYEFTCSNQRVTCSGEDPLCRARVYLSSCGCVIRLLMSHVVISLYGAPEGHNNVAPNNHSSDKSSSIIKTFPRSVFKAAQSARKDPKAAQPLCSDSPVLSQPSTIPVKPPSVSATERRRTASLSTPTTLSTRTWTLNTAAADRGNNKERFLSN